MANSGLQLLGFVLAVLGWVALVAATILPQWRMSSYAGDNIITAVAVYEGLWMSCAWQSTGQIQCKVFDSILNLSAALQATRALMIVSIVLCIVGMGIATMGMKCTRCGGDNKVQKARIAMTGGLTFVVGGLAALIACSWYANKIIQDFYNALVPMNAKYEFGSAIFIGWAGSALVLLGGGLLSCSCPGKSGYNKQYPKSKATSRTPTNKEYV